MIGMPKFCIANDGRPRVKIYLWTLFCGWFLESTKGSVTLRSFLNNFSRNAVARSVARSRLRLCFSQRIAAIGSIVAQCITPPAAFRNLRQFQQWRMRTLLASRFNLARQIKFSLSGPVADIALYCNTQPWQLATLHFQALWDKLLKNCSKALLRSF